MTENRTWLASVLFLDIVGYSKLPVDQQMAVKQIFKELVQNSIHQLIKEECLRLDTGDGCAICYLGDPESLFPVALNLRQSLLQQQASDLSFEVRAGLNLGPVKIMDGVGGEPNCVGAGINDAQRVMDFANGGQLLVSKSYFDIVNSMSSSYSQQLSHLGAKTDKHDKIHELYSFSDSESDANGQGVLLEEEVRQRIHKELARYVGSETSTQLITESILQASSAADFCIMLAAQLSEDDRYHFNEFTKYYGYSSYK